ncbi:MAG: hypothetical protein HUU54_14560 [Ignavibacteriaceae bacterium]|nr:hypothetical protein [Ignavibacteriaceae bacterium]
MEKGIGSYFAVALTALLVFSSNFIDTDLFRIGDMNIAVWFILSALCFGAGWYLKSYYEWNDGVKTLISVTASVAIITVIMVMSFGEYFAAGNTSIEKLLAYMVRNILLGSMGIFGLAVSEVISLDKEAYSLKEKVTLFEETIKDAKKESDLIIRDANIKAAKTINDAELTAKNIFLKKERIEKELKEFIQIEKELLKKYEENN